MIAMALILTMSTFNIAPDWQLTFSQDFDGAKGSAPDPKIWTRDLGGSGFGNNESQSYTDGNKNAYLDGRGNLVIEARKEKTTGADGIIKEYSSARLKTDQSFSQTYGKFEARLKMPKGQGVWPAFWMLGKNITKEGWPKCGEIDILEFLGHQTKVAYGTLHGPGFSGGASIQGKFDSPTGLDEGFHVYGVEWDPEEIRWYLDGKQFHKVHADDVGADGWVFDQPQFFILNLAVGGYWPGYPDSTTTFPQLYMIDYVRAYTDKNLKIDTLELEKRKRERAKRNVDPVPGSVNLIPGDLPFANFKLGGPGKAYSDLDPGNNGGAWRKEEQVDVGQSWHPKFKYSVGWTGAGEWLKYEVEVTETGNYDVEALVAAEGQGGSFHLEIGETRLPLKFQVPDTGGWTKWGTIQAGKVHLVKGRYEMKLVLDTNGPKNNSTGNLLLTKFTKTK
jgi:beta-glucanase (GH16 family)